MAEERRLRRADASNPFRILPPKTGAKRKPHPMINKRFPLVLMLEPLHACNLTCTGCGRIREYENTITERCRSRSAWPAVDECGAPIVSICGGEPMIYPEIGELVAGHPGARPAHLPLHQRHVHQEAAAGVHARPALLLQRPPGRHGEEPRHRAWSARACSSEAIEGIKAAKAAGFQVCTNTTVYKETDMNEIEELFEYLTQLGVDGHMISPAYGYSAVNDREIFMTRDDIHEKFQDIDRIAKKYNVQPVADLPGIPARASASCPAPPGATRPTT